MRCSLRSRIHAQLALALCALVLVGDSAASAQNQKKSAGRERLGEAVNLNTIAVISGNLNATYLTIAYDLSAVLDDGDNFRILPPRPDAEPRNATDFAAARAQLARELTQPEFETTGASKPKAPEAGGGPLPKTSESGNFGAAPSDRGRRLEPKLSSRAFDATESQQLIRRAEELLASGDIAAARLILQRMAEASEQRAALLLASTYDPLVLEKLKVYAFAADVPKARGWYEKAREMGSPEASHRLELLAQLSR